jgi:hypothetical protein
MLLGFAPRWKRLFRPSMQWLSQTSGICGFPASPLPTGSMYIAQPNLSSDSAMKDLLTRLVRDKDLRGPSATAIAEITPKVYAFGVLLSEY